MTQLSPTIAYSGALAEAKITLRKAREVQEFAWGVFYAALGDGTCVDLLRAYMKDWLRADAAVKRIIGMRLLDDDYDANE